MLTVTATPITNTSAATGTPPMIMVPINGGNNNNDDDDAEEQTSRPKPHKHFKTRNNFLKDSKLFEITRRIDAHRSKRCINKQLIPVFVQETVN